MEVITVKDLKQALSTMDDNAQIVVGCQGYLSEYNFDDHIRITQIGGAVYITDCCHYDELKEGSSND